MPYLSSESAEILVWQRLRAQYSLVEGFGRQPAREQVAAIAILLAFLAKHLLSKCWGDESKSMCIPDGKRQGNGRQDQGC
jgi:hypothetical protein